MLSIAIFRATAPWRFARHRNSSRSRSAFAPACGRGIPMTSSALAFSLPRGSWRQHRLLGRNRPLVAVGSGLVGVCDTPAVLMNLSLVRDGFEREETPYTVSDLIEGTMSAERPLLPAPHQVVETFLDSVLGYAPTAPRSLVYHSAITLSATLLGFALGALLGIGLALMIVHSRVLEKSLLPWVICSQMVPILDRK